MPMGVRQRRGAHVRSGRNYSIHQVANRAIKQKRKPDVEALEHVGLALLLALGEDPNRAGLRDTPKRFARAWYEFINYDAGNTATAFEHIAGDQMVVVSGVRVYSFCEHHLLPFWCDLAIGYIANHKVLGLSKFARIAHKHAHKLQVQERLVEEIGQEVAGATGSKDVAVFARGEHSCMVTRGIKTAGLMSSSFLTGRFKHDAKAREEFMLIAGVGR